MFICVILPGDLNLGYYPPHPTSTYTYGVTIALRVCGGKVGRFNLTVFNLSFNKKRNNYCEFGKLLGTSGVS